MPAENPAERYRLSTADRTRDRRSRANADRTARIPSPKQVGGVGRVARHQLGATPAQLGKGNGMKVQMSRWKGMDEDISDDQQDIARGRGMVDSKFQGGFGLGGTQVRAPLAAFASAGRRSPTRPAPSRFGFFP